MRKFAGFLIFVGLLLVGGAYYQKYVGDIPFLSNVKDLVAKEESEVVGPPIEVEKIDTTQYSSIVGNSYDVDKEEIEDNVNNSFFINIKLGKDAYRLSFKYPDYLTLFKGDDSELILGNDYTNIAFWFIIVFHL